MFARHLSPLIITLLLPLTLGMATTAIADTEPRLPTVDLSAEASRSAENDLARTTVHFEATERDPAALSRQVNGVIANALEQIKRYPDVRFSTAGVNTWPVYSERGRSIDAWRMRSEIRLESTNVTALSELLGQLQQNLVVTGLVMLPSPETRALAADQAATDAIKAFEARARGIAETLGKQHRLRSLNVNYASGDMPVYPTARAMMMAPADAAPAPLEGGESRIVVHVSGTIELID